MWALASGPMIRGTEEGRVDGSPVWSKWWWDQIRALMSVLRMEVGLEGESRIEAMFCGFVMVVVEFASLTVEGEDDSKSARMPRSKRMCLPEKVEIRKVKTGESMGGRPDFNWGRQKTPGRISRVALG